ncbi:restriction endonuclease [Patescibacteria group bacterium]
MAKKINVIKHGGSSELYDRQKVLQSILRSQVNDHQAQEILSRVEKRLHDGISTKSLYQIVNREIVRQDLPHCSDLYRLREAVATMDSIDFEKFVKEILTKEGFEAQWNLILNGLCIDHQIDVVAKNKNGQVYYVEVKHHRHYHRDTGLGTVIELWGRYKDLMDGYHKSRQPYDFASAWLITNTKFSRHAKKFSACKNLRLTGWHYFLKEKGQESKNGLEKEFESLGVDQVSLLVKKVIEGSLS